MRGRAPYIGLRPQRKWWGAVSDVEELVSQETSGFEEGYFYKGENPQFVVMSIGKELMEGKKLYEELCCWRGEMENRIKEQQLHLFVDLTSSAKMRANQLRLWFSLGG